jgi:[pyruvate, water dikinase]-phosphate phosphotransferase / [pyruvate, water dikinase] kinase
MTRLHLHLISDSTGETLETVAKSALALFDGVEMVKHFWPMVRSEVQLGRIIEDVAANPGLTLYTIVNPEMRAALEAKCGAAGLPAIAVLDPVVDALASLLGQPAKARRGYQHNMDDAYFRRVEAIQFTIAHDDGAGAERWHQADIILAGVSRTSKTPTAIYLANRGYKTANIPIVIESPPPPSLYELSGPLIVGLVINPERLIQVRRNRLLSLNQSPETDYVDVEKVAKEVAFARRIFADQSWPVIDVTRRSIEEVAAAIITMVQNRADGASAS